MLPGIISAASYYVDATNGRDTNTGLSDVQAWKTVGKVNRYSFSSGDDVYFKAGGTWNETLTIDWGGIASNRAVVGSYYMNGGSETIGVPAGIAKPTFKGTCVSSSNCPVDVASAIPASRWLPLIDIKGNYTIVQNLKVKNSSGAGISVHGSSKGKQQYNNNYILDNFAENILMNAVFLARTSHTNVVRGNFITKAAMVKPYGHNSNWPAAIGLALSDTNIIEDNYIYHSFGESIGVFDKSHYNIIRNNLIAKGNKPGIYISCSDDNIIENNKVLGDRTDPLILLGNGYPSIFAYGTSSEAYCSADTKNNVFRNNLAANVQYCFYNTIEKDAATSGYKAINNAFYNNTCVNAYIGFANISNEGAGNAYATFHNNIVTDVNIDCSQVDSRSTVDYNHWDATPSDLDCRGANDIAGNPGLNVTTGWDTVGASNIPDDQDFNVASNSSVANAATPLTSTVFTYADYPQFTMLTGEIDSTCKFDLKTNANDHNCKTRHVTTPSIGAFDVGNMPPQQNVMLPFYMNIGGDVIGPLPSGKSYETEQYRITDGAPATYANSNTDPLNGTADDAVFQSWRGTNDSMAWRIPVANGSYDLTLLYQERYWGVSGGFCTAAGSNRKFDVSVEGVQLRNEFDICAVAGAPNTAVRDVIQNISVTDGELDIQLSLGAGQDPKPELMGLEITVAAPVPSPPANLIVR